jgi:hypothetical protein
MALINKFTVYAAEGLGSVSAPSWLARWNTKSATGEEGQGLFTFIGVVLSIATIIAGIYLIIQLILAGYMYMSANGDPKKVEIAGAKIWQSMLGLIIVAGALTLASVIARLVGIPSLVNFKF